MKSSIAPLILCSALTAIPAWAQAQVSGTPPGTTSPGTATPEAPVSGGAGSTSIASGVKKAVAARSVRPGSTTPAEKPKAAPDVKPPDEPIEAYLLSKENGPFMVMAMVFRGPEAEKMALALCKELRHDSGLPAYILRTKDFPRPGNAVANPPGAVRHHEEVAVLVGDEKTKEATEVLLKKVKTLQPKCLNDMPRMWTYQHGIGLSRALRTTNPYLSPGRLQARR
jgi:hypothetical protein